MILFFATIVIALFGATYAAGLARGQARSPVFWGSLAVLAAAVALATAYGLVTLFPTRWGPLPYLVVAALLPLSQLAVIIGLARLDGAPRQVGDDIAAYVMGEGDRDGYRCRLHLGPASVAVSGGKGNELSIPLLHVVRAEVDGQCVRIEWTSPDESTSSLFILPGAGPTSPRTRVMLSEAICRRIEGGRRAPNVRSTG